jgi:hypothetical protein
MKVVLLTPPDLKPSDPSIRCLVKEWVYVWMDG